MCPAILIKQWTKEIEKNTRPHLNVVILSTMKAINTCSYRDIMDAGKRGEREVYREEVDAYLCSFFLSFFLSFLDVVLFSHKMLLDAEYFNSVNNMSFKSEPRWLTHITERREWVNKDFAVCFLFFFFFFLFFSFLSFAFFFSFLCFLIYHTYMTNLIFLFFFVSFVFQNRRNARYSFDPFPPLYFSNIHSFI